MSHDNLSTLIRLALVLSLASSLVGLQVGLLTEGNGRDENKKKLEKEKTLQRELDNLREEITQLKAQINRAIH